MTVFISFLQGIDFQDKKRKELEEADNNLVNEK